MVPTMANQAHRLVKSTQRHLGVKLSLKRCSKLKVQKQTVIHGLGKSLLVGVSLSLVNLKNDPLIQDRMAENGVKQKQKGNFTVRNAVLKTLPRVEK